MNVTPITNPQIDTSEILLDLKSIEEDTTLLVETNFDNRANALDFIEFHIIDRIEGLLQYKEHTKELDTLYERTHQTKSMLEKVNSTLFKQLRENIRMGMYTHSSFNKMIHDYLTSYFNNANPPEKIGYDNLDVFITGLSSEAAIPEHSIELKPEMVFYQKTPARIIFELSENIKLKDGDVFFDIGSGLGQVNILLNLLMGAKTIGVEYEPAYCNYAKACAKDLNLPSVEFINSDARYADYSQGTIFFLYTPFEKSMLQDMLDVLQNESQKRNITIFTYGPCSIHLARQNWLRCINDNVDDNYKLYEFNSLNS